MATRTSLYSFQNNIIEIGISVDAIGELHSANEPLTKEERIKFGLLDGDNPWRHLGLPDFVLEKPKEVENNIETDYSVDIKMGTSLSSSSTTTTAMNSKYDSDSTIRKRSLSTASISTEDITLELEEFSKAWGHSDEIKLEVSDNYNLVGRERDSHT